MSRNFQFVHFLPVVVSAVVVFVLGWLWYSPALFGKLWMQAHGHTGEKLKEMQATAGRKYAVSFVCSMIMAVAMSILIGRTGVMMLEGGIKLGLLVGVGFAVPLGLTAHMFSEKRPSAYLIDAGYQIVYLMVMGAILAVWH